MRYGWLAIAALLACSACQTMPMGGSAAAQTESLAVIPLQIRSAASKSPLRFEVEVAQTTDQQARGLMFRESLPPFGGMLFPMSPPRDASFWMKNTVIPLDIIFVRADGSIARIAAQTTPYSLTPVVSGEPVAAVLEIAGGRAAELGIAEGDHVLWDLKSK